MKFRKLLAIPILFFSTIFAQEWTMRINAQDVNQIGSLDYIILGMCDDCNDNFHFGEDEYDLPNGGFSFTDIQFTNPDWIGQIDENNVTCNSFDFYIDKKAFHEPSDLLTWQVSGYTQELSSNTQVLLEWEMDQLSNEYEVFLYIGQTSYNMRLQSSLIVSASDLQSGFDMDTFQPIPNVKILLGGCASTGTGEYYQDQDQDGLGSGNPQSFCPGLEPIGWVENNNDINDEIFCESNYIDLCNVCDGSNICVDCNNVVWGNAFYDSCGVCSDEGTNNLPNNDLDCNNNCFGSAIIDDCGICSEGSTGLVANSNQDCTGLCFGDAAIDNCNECNGFNQSCLEEIFNSGPQDVYAYIYDDFIELTWNQSNFPEDNRIIGFNIYKQQEELIFLGVIQDEQVYTIPDSDGTFCVSAYDQYGNESSINCANASEMLLYNFTLVDGANLISFPALPIDTSLENIFNNLGDNIRGVITEGKSALKYNNEWVGSLEGIEPHRGYWLLINLDDIFGTEVFSLQGFPTSSTLQYTLFEGANLVSYLGIDNTPLNLALPSDLEIITTEIIYAGSAAQNHPTLGWIGSLATLDMGRGYWIKVSEGITFQWNSDLTINRISKGISNTKTNKSGFRQSASQSFYYIETIQNIPPKNDYEILAYCNNTLTGKQIWNGTIIDIAIMGNDGSDYSKKYCKEGDIPQFKLYSKDNQKLIELYAENTPSWKNNNLNIINLTKKNIEKPNQTEIINVYPNPFNPSTTITYSIISDTFASLSIIDINGKIVKDIPKSFKQAGIYETKWNAYDQPSGMYFLKLLTENNIITKKILLIK